MNWIRIKVRVYIWLGLQATAEAGVKFNLWSKASASLLRNRPVNERPMTVRFGAQPFNTFVVQVYGSSSQGIDDTVDLLYNDPKQTLKVLPKRNVFWERIELGLFGHICRKNGDRKIKILVFGMMDGKNKWGQPHSGHDIMNWCGASVQEPSRSALEMFTTSVSQKTNCTRQDPDFRYIMVYIATDFGTFLKCLKILVERPPRSYLINQLLGTSMLLYWIQQKGFWGSLCEIAYRTLSGPKNALQF